MGAGKYGSGRADSIDMSALLPVLIVHLALAQTPDQAPAEGLPQAQAQVPVPAQAQAPAQAPAETASRPASEPEVEALRQEAAQERQREEDTEALAQESAERVAALQRQLEQIEQRGREIEANRVGRADAYGNASGTLSNAQAILAGGSTDVALELDSAEQVLAVAADNAGRFGGEQERAVAVQSLDGLEAARSAIAQGDLYQARLDLLFAADAANRALAVATSSAHPLPGASGP